MIASISIARGQVLRVDFESPTWPSATTNFLYTTPSNWSRTVPLGSGNVVFDMTNWGLWGNEAAEASRTYFGAQAARCRYPQASNGVTGDSVISARAIPDPRGVAFKIASNGISSNIADSRHWVLELWTVGVGGPMAGQSTWHKSWTSLYGDIERARFYVRESVDLTSLPNGTYDIELRVTQHSNSGSSFEVFLDDLEIFMGTDRVEATPVPLESLALLIDGLQTPAAQNNDQRQSRSWMMRDLDRHVSTYHALHYGVGDVQTETLFTKYFRSRVRRVAQEVAETVPDDDEIVVWKLYSSGYVVKTPKYTFGFDVQQGPNPNEVISAHSQNIAMAMTEDDVDALVAQLDFVFYTHYHHDHTNFDFVARLISKGKRVFAPSAVDPSDTRDLREQYMINGTGIYSSQVAMIEDPYVSNPNGGFLSNLGLDVHTYKGVQSSAVMLTPSGGIPAPAPWDPVNYSYHVLTENGIGLIFIGDSRQVHSSSAAVAALDPILNWFQLLSSQGRHVDLKLGSGPFIESTTWRGVFIPLFKPVVRTAGHEWEMNHSSFTILTNAWNDSDLLNDSAFPLSVGERWRYRHFLVKPHIDAPTLTSSSATVNFETSLAMPATLHYGTASDFANGVYPNSITETAPTRTHAFQLSNLSPGATYYYHVTTGARGVKFGFLDAATAFTTLSPPSPISIK